MIHVVLVNGGWVSPSFLSLDWSGWYESRVYQLRARPSSLGVYLPSSGRSDMTSDEDDGSSDSRDIDFHDLLCRHFSFPNNGRGVLPISTVLYNKFVGRIGSLGLWNPCLSHWTPGTPLSRRRARLRNVKAGAPAMARRLHIGTVARVGGQISIHNLEGRMTNTVGSAFGIDSVHHFGREYHAREWGPHPFLLSHVRIVYIDTRTFKWCSLDSFAFHSFAWPRITREARGIARTLFTNHCKGGRVGCTWSVLWSKHVLS